MYSLSQLERGNTVSTKHVTNVEG
ncbi:Protein of unknown function [Bacillus cereus]|nr:Protein of unknown function [Bacillus cereus]